MQVIPPPRDARQPGDRRPRIAALFLCAGALVLCSHRASFAVQASGSIVVVPSKQIALIRGETFEVRVYFQNDSTGASGDPISARVRGPIRLTTILDAAGEERSTVLQFVPGPDSGCLARAGAVRACAAGTAGEFLIHLDPTGLPLPAADAPTLVASISLYNPHPALPRTSLRASIEPCALEACESTAPRTSCTAGGAAGDTFVSGISPVVPGCQRRCKGAIEYRNAAFDRLSVKGELEISDPNFDPTGSPRILLRKGSGEALVRIDDAGSLQPKGSTFELVGAGSFEVPGIQLIRLTPRASGKFLLEIEVFDDLSTAESYMPLEIDFAGTFSTFFEYWKPRPGGRGWVTRKPPR